MENESLDIQKNSEISKEPKKKGNKGLIVFLVLVILAMGGYITYDKVLKDKYFSKDSDKPSEVKTDENNKEETKETDTENSKEFVLPYSLKAYMSEISNINNVVPGDISTELLLADKSFRKIDFKLDEKCKKDGDNISFEENGNKISYTCHYDSDMESFYTTATVNDVFKTEHSEFMTCGEDLYYTNGTYYINYQTGCFVGGMLFSVYKNNTLLKQVENISYPTSLSEEYGDSLEYTTPFIKNNSIYYITFDDSDTTLTSCNIKGIDMNNETLTEKTGNSFKCYYGNN